MHPTEEHIFLTGQSNKTVCQWDTRIADNEKANVIQYERHTKAVNTITFFDGGNKIMTSRREMYNFSVLFHKTCVFLAAVCCFSYFFVFFCIFSYFFRIFSYFFVFCIY